MNELPDGSSRGEPVETAARDTLRDSAIRGVRWVSVARVATELGGLASMVVLAHLLSPAEFGRATLAGLLNAVLAAMLFRALGAPLIKLPDLHRRHVQTGLLLSLAVGVGMSGAAFLAATFTFGPVFGDDVVGLGQLASLGFLAGGASAVPRAVLLRKLDVKGTSAVDMVSAWMAIAVSVALALAGLDAEALVIGGLVGVAVNAAMMLVVARVPRPRWDVTAARALASFGVPASLASLFNALAKNADYAILGMRLDATQVGLYWRAHRLGVEYQTKLTGVMMDLALPVYSRASGSDDMQRLRFRITRMHATIALPALALFIPVAPVLIPWLFGDPWEPATVPAQILAVGGMAAALGSGTGSFVLAAGRPWTMVRFNLALLAVFSATVFFTAPHGLDAVCAGVVGVRIALLLANYHLLLGPLIGVPVRRLWLEVVPGAVSTAIVLAVVWPLTEVVSATDLGAVPVLASAFAAGAAVYLLTMRGLFPATFAEVAAVARALTRRGSRPRDLIPAAGA